MLVLGTRVYARIHYSTFVFLSFTSFTTAVILSKSPPPVKDFYFLAMYSQHFV